MEYPLNQAMQSTLAVLTKVAPGDLDAPTPCASWDVRALVNHADYAAGDFVAAYGESIAIAAQAFEADRALERTVRLPFGPAAEAPDGAGPADQLAAFLGRAV